MSLLAIWFPPVGAFGVLLAALGAGLSLIGFAGWRRIVYASLFVLLGIGDVVSAIRADGAHQVELKAQHDDIENLRAELRKSEVHRQVSEAYLKAKLEDSYQMYSQLAESGPALLKLAQTSAESERKQYEAKVRSAKELYDFTMGVVRKIRDFSQKYRLLEAQESESLMNSMKQPQLSDADRQQRWNQAMQKEIQLNYNRDFEFRSTILPDAVHAKYELQKRKVPDPPLSPVQRSEVDMVLRGVLAGSYPELAVADYLELMAKQLSLK